MTPVLDDPGARYRVGARTLLSLLAGRGAYRLVQLGTTVALLPAWGAVEYGRFAAAVGTFTWLTALIVTGPEKTVLKLLPRARRTGPMLVEALLAAVWWVQVPLVCAFGVARLAGAPPTTLVYLGVATMHVVFGCTLLLVGLNRAVGRPGADAATFLVLSALLVLLLGGAAAGLVGVTGYVATMVAAQVCLNVVLAVRLGRPSLRIRRRPGYLRRLVWTTVLMSGTDLSMYLSSGVLFAILAATAPPAEVGAFFVVLLVWSVAVNLLIYVLRVYAPRTSLRLAGPASRRSRTRVTRLAGRVAAYNLAWLAGVAALLLATDPARGGQVVLWLALLVARLPAVVGLILAGYLVENGDATGPGVAASAAVAGLLVAAAGGLAVIAPLGTVGALIAYAAAELTQALVLWLRVRRSTHYRVLVVDH